jgi:hypothetical protein
VPVKYGRFALNTATGDQTIATGVGEALKGVIVWGVALTAAGYGAGYKFTIGASDGTDAWCFTGGADDNVATSNTWGAANTDRLGHIQSAEATDDLVFDIDTATPFESDGDFRINISNAPAAAYVMHYLAFYGDDVGGTKCRTVDCQLASGDQAITGVGFQPTWGFLSFPVQTAGNNATVRLSLGSFHSTSQQHFLGMVDGDALADGQVGVIQRTDKICGFASSTGTLSRTAAFKQWDADGFTMTWDAANSTQRPMNFFFVDIADVWVGALTADTGGAAQDVTSPAFGASGFMALSYDQAASTTIDTSSANCAKVTIGGGDDADEGCIWIGTDDGAATMDTNMRHVEGKGLAFSDFSQTTVGEADIAPASDGLDVTWSDAPPRASQILLTVFGGGSATVDVQVAIAAASSVIAAVKATRSVAPAVAASSSVAVTPKATRRVAASIESASSVSAAVTKAVAAAAAITGSSSVAAVAKRLGGVKPVIAASSSVEVVTRATMRVTPSIAGASGISASPRRVVGVSAAIAASSSVAASVSRVVRVAASIAASSSVAAAVKRTRGVQALIAAASDVTITASGGIALVGRFFKTAFSGGADRSTPGSFASGAGRAGPGSFAGGAERPTDGSFGAGGGRGSGSFSAADGNRDDSGPFLP